MTKQVLHNDNYIKVCYSSETDSRHVEGVGDEVDHVPHVVDVLLQADIPQLLNFTPY